MDDTVKVKASLKFEENCLLEISSSITLTNLKNDVKKSFPLLNQQNVLVKLSWIDRDGDKISLHNDADLTEALRHVSGKLQLDVQVFELPQLDQQSSVSTALQLQYNVRNPPRDSQPRGSQPVSQQHPAEETWSRPRSTDSTILSTYRLATDSSPVQETVVRQNSSQSEPSEADQLDIPADIPLFEEWPAQNSYGLKMVSKTKSQLDGNIITERMYMTDPGKQTRVLCFVNKESGGKTLYPGNNMDSECTFLQTFCKKVKWDLQIKKNKTSEEIEEILKDEYEKDFETCHSLFVIILTRGDRHGIYGTHGGLFEYWKLTTMFDQVQSLKGKPKIFIIDDCEIGSDIHDNEYPTTTGEQQTNLTQPNTGGLQTDLIQPNTVVLQTDLIEPNTAPKQTSTSSGHHVSVDQRDCENVPNMHSDSYICLASTLGRSDEIVKGSWLIGALISVMCKAANRMTFQQMMRQVQIMLRDATIPSGKPRPELKITDHLTKDFYVFPPPS